MKKSPSMRIAVAIRRNRKPPGLGNPAIDGGAYCRGAVKPFRAVRSEIQSKYRPGRAVSKPILAPKAGAGSDDGGRIHHLPAWTALAPIPITPSGLLRPSSLVALSPVMWPRAGYYVNQMRLQAEIP
jgi:hypothetical protein